MTDKYIELLRIQMAKLEEADFDLEAWKSGSIVLLSRIFGDSSSKLNQLEKIKFDFGSWSLRDSTGSKDQMESCKKRCRGILEASIIELEVLGVEEEIELDVDTSTLAISYVKNLPTWISNDGSEPNIEDMRKEACPTCYQVWLTWTETSEKDSSMTDLLEAQLAIEDSAVVDAYISSGGIALLTERQCIELGGTIQDTGKCEGDDLLGRIIGKQTGSICCFTE